MLISNELISFKINKKRLFASMSVYKKWWSYRDLNSGPLARQASALPLSYNSDQFLLYMI